MANGKAEKQEAVTVSREYLEELQYQETSRRLESDFNEWSKKRFRITLIVVGIFGFIGIQAIGYFVIDMQLGEKIVEANAAVQVINHEKERMSEETRSLKRQADEMSIKAEEQSAQVSNKIAELAEHANKLQKQFADIEAEIKASSENVRAEQNQEIRNIQAQIEKLVSNVNQLESKMQVSSNLQQDFDKLKKDSESLRKEFTRNSRFSVTVYSKNEGDNTERVVESLRLKGYKAAYSDYFGIYMNTFLKGKPEGLIVYSEASREQAEEIQNILKKALPELGVSLVETPYSPRSGYITRATETVFRIFVPEL